MRFLSYTVLSFFSFSFLYSADESAQQPLPGRVGSNQIFYTELGKARIFFYMTEEKDALARQFIQSLNHNNLQISSEVTSLPCPVSEISAVAIKHGNANFELEGTINRDTENRPTYADPIGQDILNSYARDVIAIAEELLGIKIEGLSRDLSLNANQDALKLHKDRFGKQYQYLSELPLPIERYTLFQDLTLVDWQMAESSFSATMVQDGDDGDRFLMALFPGEVFGAIYSEPMIYKGANISPTYPGPITFPFHTAVAPIDYYGSCQVGSWKGKRISTSTRGVVLESSMERAKEKAVFLPINRPLVTQYAPEYKSYTYENGIDLRELPDAFPKEVLKNVIRHEDQENITIFEGNSSNYHDEIQMLKAAFQLEGDIKHVFHLTKRDGGFSRFEKIFKNLSNSVEIILVNHSYLPEVYKHYQVAEDCTKYGMPWIHMYRFPLKTAMKVPPKVFFNMALTPVEEILYRNEKKDEVSSEESYTIHKLKTKIDVFVFAKE